ncbi:restriction endonuclease subunit S [Enterovibrio coralii]|uniref:Type I restriction modification DNA specificity domain-containing protein n=1 Tax=Enterovibrio coralii TaxID=294935 RepID=A0A135I2R7_9GAMM|nr:restriction endonuclease subunit S [Enterovibrio coralii]KXF79743.1 hypothetical protein ATN88_12540 [Enterovibrio coralii]
MGSNPVVTTKLSDLCELIVDCPHSTPKWTDSGFVVLRNQNIRNGALDLTSPSYTDEAGYNSRIKRAVPQAGDIVITREAPMGEVCIIPEGLQCCLGQRQVLLRPKKGISNEYLFWALQSPFVKHQISWNEGTGTTVSNIRIPVLKAFEIPRWFEQEPQIAAQLSAIDNKITLNRQISQTLEQMAQKLFKSWFVDFDPVIDNAQDAGNPIPDEQQHRAEARKAVRESEGFKQLPDDVRRLFPDAFEESELGWVPKGWAISSVSEISEILNGFAFKSGDYATSGQFVLRTKNFENGEVARANDDVFLPDSFLDSHKKYLCEPYDYHLVMVGASVGKCAMIFPHQLPALRNQNMWCFRAKKNSIAHQSYVKYMLDMLVSKSIGLASGSAREFFRKGDFGNQKVCVGDELIQSQFELICSKWTEKKAKNAEQLDSLTRLRDTLLPKLISGELRLDDVEAAVVQETVSA